MGATIDPSAPLVDRLKAYSAEMVQEALGSETGPQEEFYRATAELLLLAGLTLEVFDRLAGPLDPAEVDAETSAALDRYQKAGGA